MKKLICELCGSQHLVKKDEFYVCESCGTKFTAEEAKRLLVDVNVVVDKSEETEKLYEVARRSLKNGSYGQAESTYKKILNDRPDDWEAYFLSEYCNAMECTIGEIAPAARQIQRCLDDTFALITELGDENEMNTAVSSVVSWCISASNLFITSAFNHHQKFMDVSGNMKEFKEKCCAVGNMLIECINGINNRFPCSKYPNINIHFVTCAKHLMELARIYGSYGVITDSNKDTVVEMIKPYDKEYAEAYYKKKHKGKVVVFVFWLILLIGNGVLMYVGREDFSSFSFMFGAGMGLFSLIGTISSITSLIKK